MTGWEKALENYEQALFTLLLNEVAEAEGDRLLEEQAQLSDEDVPIGEEAHRRCRQLIAKHRRQEKRRSAGHRAARGLGKAAIAALVAVLLFTTAFATIESFRIKTYNVIIDLFDDHMSIGVVEKEDEEGAEDTHLSQPTPAPVLAVNWLPAGFTLDHEGTNIMSTWVQYVNAEEDIISVLAAELTTGNMNFNTEDAELSTISLHGTAAQLIVGEELVQVIWSWEADPTWLLSVTTQGLDSDTAVKIAENVSAAR